HKQADQLQQLLEAAGIPFRSKRPTNVLDDLPVRQLRQLLTYFLQEQERPLSGEYLLYRILHFRCFNLAPQDLAQLSIYQAKQSKEGEGLAWRFLLSNPPAELVNKPAAVKTVGHWLEECLALLNSVPLTRFVERVVNGSGLLAWATRREDRFRQLSALTTFLDFVRTEVVRRPRLDLAGLLTTLVNMDENRVRLPLRTQLEPADAITLVTAHSAKGLEFECVWILDANDREWGGKSRSGGQGRFTFPSTLTLSGEADAEEARRRLFFVAMTRARRTLIISYARLNAARKPQTAAPFVSELLESGSHQFEEKRVSLATLESTIPLRLGKKQQDINLADYESEAIAEL
ncbi:MAG: 3'-5' exonuclease, partial [Bacteroidota bacterium]